jgi:hypothetical protein
MPDDPTQGDGPARGALPSATDTLPPPPAAAEPPKLNPVFDTPKIEPKPLAAPPQSNFMADLAKAFTAQSESAIEPAPSAAPADADNKTLPKAEPPASSVVGEPPPNLTPKAKEHWRLRDQRVQAEISQREERIRALESELESERKRALAPVEELNKIKTERDELGKRLERFDIERSPLYKEKVIDRQEALKTRIGKIAEGTPLNSGAIDSLLNGELSTRERVLDSQQLSSYRKGQIIELLDQWDGVQEDKAKLLADGKASFEAYQAEQRARSDAERAEYVRQNQRLFDDQMTLFGRQLEVYQPMPYDPTAQNAEFIKKWNEGVEVMRADARTIHSGAVDPQRLAQVAILAPAALRYREMFTWAMQQNKQLQEQIERLRGVQPTVRDSGADIGSSRGGQLSSRNGDFVRSLVDRFNKEAGA